MPSNRDREATQRALQYCQKIIESLPPCGVHKRLLVFQVFSVHPGSQKAINDFLEANIEAGVLLERNGVLYRAEVICHEHL